MTATINEPIVPSADDIQTAKEFSRTLAREQYSDGTVTIQRQGHGEAVEVPAKIFDVMMKVLSIMSQGKAFSLFPMDEELTTQQAADFLNVSRPYLNKILDLGEINHRKVGRNRRVLFRDVLEYKQKQVTQSKEALSELAKEAQELGMGY